MVRRFLAAVIIVVVAAGLVVAVWPQVFGLATAPVVAQIVSLRGLAVAVALVLVIALTLAALLAPSARRFAASLAVALLLFCAVSVAVLSTRGFGDPSFESATDNDITVLSWNTLGDAPGAEVIAQLALDTGAEVVSLPETTNDVGLEIARIMADAGQPMWVHTLPYDQISKARSTTLLISVDLGEYDVNLDERTTSTLPSVVATPQDGTGPTFIAVHAVAPVPGEMQNWRSDLQWLRDACASGSVIMAGDFNSTIDHYSGLATEVGATIGACADAGLATDNAAVGTWPTSLPALVGSPIDHVMATDDWRVSGMRVIESHDKYGSDHRPVLVQLSPTGGD
jgi:endonuclease/exonuclease/phosphatase (EEP) superfamily protein YafD